MSTPIGSSCRTTAELGVVGAAAPGRRADEVAELDLGQADPAVDRRGHPAVAQVDLGVDDRGLRPVDVGLGGEDVRLVVGLGLLQAGLVGLDLRRVLLAERLLALDVLDVDGVALAAATARAAPRPRRARASPGRARAGPSRPPAPWSPAPSSATASACSSFAWASASLALKGSSSMTNRSWPVLTSAPSLKCISLRNPRTRARIETSWRARVVPIGSAMIGTVIRRASTTDTTGGGGDRSAPARDEQPEIVTEAQATPRASQRRILGLYRLIGTMVPLLIRRVRADSTVRRPTLISPRSSHSGNLSFP